jgi:hypothetical protein
MGDRPINNVKRDDFSVEQSEARKIKVIKPGDKPALKKNPKLGEVKLTKWKRLINTTREEWLKDHEEEKAKEKEQLRAYTESCFN